MRTWTSGLVSALILGGCQTPAPPPVLDPTLEPKVVVHPGDAVLSAVGTPFLLAFKTVVCAASVAVAAPIAGLVALSQPRWYSAEAQHSLGDGLAQNCGPPYVLSPYRVVLVPAEPPAVPMPDEPPAAGPEQVPPAPPGAPVPLLPD